MRACILLLCDFVYFSSAGYDPSITAELDINPFRFSGPLSAEEMIDRDQEADELLALAAGRHSFRLVGPRRYGKTTLLRRVLEAAEQRGMATVLVDLQDVLSIAEIVVRIERGYQDRLKGPIRRQVDTLLKAWNIGVSLAGGGFTASLQRNPGVDAESVLLRVLELPAELFKREGITSLVVFDEIQDVLGVPGADGKIRSVIQHHGEAATYAFAGSAPGMMEQLFADPKRPLLEQAVPKELAPLPLDEVAAYVEKRFRKSKRKPGPGIGLLTEFARGHPQRSMMLAHYLWNQTRPGDMADEGAWLQAQERALKDSAKLMRAVWQAMPANERRVARALAVLRTPLHSAETASAVGIKRSSIGKALAALLDAADVIEVDGRPRLTDPMLELWLQHRGLAPPAGEDVEADG